MQGQIFITETDRDRLKQMIEDESDNGRARSKSIRNLECEINKATVVSSQELSSRVMSMNTRALVCLNGEDVEVSLVYPRDADWAKRKLSILSPIGTAILGYCEGEKIQWEVPSGTTEIYIKRILYQPEAAGDYHL